MQPKRAARMQFGAGAAAALGPRSNEVQALILEMVMKHGTKNTQSELATRLPVQGIAEIHHVGVLNFIVVGSDHRLLENALRAVTRSTAPAADQETPRPS